MAETARLTTAAACRVARLHHDRFNEHVAAGNFGCAPQTIPGRSRFFDSDDMIALCLFRELMDDGLKPKKAGSIACVVAEAARDRPESAYIFFVEFEGGLNKACADENVLMMTEQKIRKVTRLNINEMRSRIAAHSEFLEYS